jgi:hypothetical protein
MTIYCFILRLKEAVMDVNVFKNSFWTILEYVHISGGSRVIKVLTCVKVFNAYNLWVTEEAGVAVTLQTYIREVVSSYPARSTNFLT